MQSINFIIQLVIRHVMIRSLMLLGIVTGLCCFVLPLLGSLGAVLFATVLLSLLVAAASGYLFIVRKTTKIPLINREGLNGWVGKIHNWRNFGFILILIAAFVSSLCFVIHVPSLNGLGFIFVFLTIPVFAGVYYYCRKASGSVYTDWLIIGRSLFWSLGLTPFLMVLLYGLILYCFCFVPVYDNLQAAIDAQPKPWDGANSLTLWNIGELSNLWGACRDYGVGLLFQIDKQQFQINGQPFPINQYLAVILVAIGYLALFFNICSLVAFCLVPLQEYKRLVLPLIDELELPETSPQHFFLHFYKPFIVLLILCAVLFCLDKPREEQDVAIIKPLKKWLLEVEDQLSDKDAVVQKVEELLRGEFVRDMIDPLNEQLEKFHDGYTRLNAQREELQNKLSGLKNNTFLELKKLHEEEVFPRMERNVDGYLNWYYSITGEYARLFNSANIGQHLEGKLNEYLMKDVDIQKVEQRLKRFSDEADEIVKRIAEIGKQMEQIAETSKEFGRFKEEYQAKLKQKVVDILAEHKVPFPEDMSSVEIVKYASIDEFLESFPDIFVELSSTIERFEAYTHEVRELLMIFAQHKNEWLSFKTRMTAANAAGIAGLGVGAAVGIKIAAKIAEKQAFKTAVAAVGKMLVKRTVGVGGGAGGGAVVGGAIGSVVPVVGTAAGAFVGGLAGAAGAWFATDYVFVKLEEHISRENFKNEILYSVNQQKGEVIKALEGIFQVNKTSAPQTLHE
jgi:hypothetical protein